MGLFWKKVASIPLGVSGGYNVTGDPNAFDKHLRPYGAWRWQHNWQVFNVADDVPWYNVYFESGSSKMMYRSRLRTNRFAARIGKQDIRFVAIGPDELPLRLSTLGARYNYQEIHRKIAADEAKPTIRPRSRIQLV